MTPEQFQQELNRLAKEFKELYNVHAPIIAANTAVSYFKKNFQNEAWGRVKWQEVKRRQPTWTRNGKTIKNPYSGAKLTRKILSGDTSDLGRSIEIKSVENGEATIWTNPSAFTSKEPYGRVHNEGLQAGRGAGFIMPKRQFIGESPELNRLIIKAIESKLKKIVLK